MFGAAAAAQQRPQAQQQLTTEELDAVERFRDELGIPTTDFDGEPLTPEETVKTALRELGIAGATSLRDSFMLVEGEMWRSEELRAQAKALHGGDDVKDFEDPFDDDDDDDEPATSSAHPAPAAAEADAGAGRGGSFSSADLLGKFGPSGRVDEDEPEDDGVLGWMSKAASSLGAAARGDGAGRVVKPGGAEPSPPASPKKAQAHEGPGAVCAYAEDGTLLVTFLVEGPIGVGFDPPTWPRVQHIEETGLATQLKELRGGLILTQIHGTDVARMPMNEAFAIFMKAGRPVTLLFGAPQPDVVATFETEGTLGINFLRSSANPLNLAKIGESGLAAQLPQLRADLLLTHVGDKCVAGVKPPYDGALKMIKDAGRPVTLTFSPLPPDLRPKSQKDPAADDSDDHGVLNLEPMKMSNDVAAVSGSGMPSIHEGWLEKNRPKGFRLIWQARYFVLDVDYLCYYESIEMATQYGGGKIQGEIVKRGEISIASIRSVSTPDDVTIIIATVDAPEHDSARVEVAPSAEVREPYKLRAENADAASRWVYHLTQACERQAQEDSAKGLKVSWSNCGAAMDELAVDPTRGRKGQALANEWTPSPRSDAAGTPIDRSQSGGFTARDDSGVVAIEEREANGARLRAMALNGALPVLRGLIASITKSGNGAVVLDEAGSDGQTALHIAAQHGHEKAVGALIDGGAAVNSVNTVTGRTPLHVSCVAGHGPTVALLLQVGADVTLADKRGRTALEAARRAKQSEVLELPDWPAGLVAAANAAVSPAKRGSPRASVSPKVAAEGVSSPASGSASSRLARLEMLSAGAAAAPEPALAAAEEEEEEI